MISSEEAIPPSSQPLPVSLLNMSLTRVLLIFIHQAKMYIYLLNSKDYDFQK